MEIAKAEGADAICHGCTGKGNDQGCVLSWLLRPRSEMKTIAPWRIWVLKSREEETGCEAHNIPPEHQRNQLFKDKNIWHLPHEGLGSGRIPPTSLNMMKF